MLPILCLLLINTVTMTAHPVDRLPKAREERKNSSIMESALSRYSPRTGEEREEGGEGGGGAEGRHGEELSLADIEVAPRLVISS